MSTKIFTILAFIGALAVGYFLYDSIDSTIKEAKEIERVETLVKQRLGMIRDAQIAYQATYGDYADTWEKLIAYVDSGKIWLIQRTETIEILDYGAEKSTITFDTIGSKPVLDSIFKPDEYPNFDPMKLPELPHAPGKYFSLYAQDSLRNNVNVDYIEVVDTYPFDRTRTEDNDIPNRRPLKFGSRTEITTAGNWQ